MFKLKSFIAGFLVCLILLTFVPISAAIQEYVLQKSDCKLYVNSTQYQFSEETPMLNYNGYNYAPLAVLKSVCEQVGAEFYYDNNTKIISIVASQPQEPTTPPPVEPPVEEPVPEEPVEEPPVEEPPVEPAPEPPQEPPVEEPQVTIYYYFRINDGVIMGRGTKTEQVFSDNQIEVSEDIYNKLKRVPSNYETNSEGDIISVSPVYSDPPETTYYYHVKISGNKIVSRGKRSTPYTDSELSDTFIEVSKEIFNKIKLPSYYQMDEDGNIIDVTPVNP